MAKNDYHKEWQPTLLFKHQLEKSDQERQTRRKQYSQMSEIEAQKEHERLLLEIKAYVKLEKHRQKSPASDDKIDLSHLIRDSDLLEFYEYWPQFDPKFSRWSDEYRALADTLDASRDHCWLKRSTWLRDEALNMLCGYHPERPASIFTNKHKWLLSLLDIDLNVAISPVNPNDPPDQHRFKPLEFVNWASEFIGGTPPPLDKYFREDRNGKYYIDDGNSESSGTSKMPDGRASYPEARRNEHRAAIRLALEQYKDECLGKRGKPSGEAIAGAVENHWEYLNQQLGLKYEKLGHRAICDLACDILRPENVD